MPTEVDFARLAAFIDGEGMIDIHTHRQFREHLNRVYERQLVRVIIVNTDPRLAAWLHGTFGGHVGFTQKRSAKWRPTARWYVSTDKAVELLRECYPYMILKREQAEVAFDFQKTVTQGNGRKGHSEETKNIRLRLQAELKRLKRVPVVDVPVTADH